ncbi:MAG: hypothetical protein ABUR63_09950, partial [Verrucomicrobiota bacterium]
CVRAAGGAGGIAGAAGSGGVGGVGGLAGGGGSRDAAVDLSMDKGPPPCSVDANTCAADKPICDPIHLACRACETSPDCQGLKIGKPVCRLGGEAGRAAACVECTQDRDCTDRSKPVCDQSTNSCVGCAKDDDCGRFAPGVCKTAASGADAGATKGHCVGDDETIYVSKTAGCSDTPATASPDAGADAGVQGESSGRPFCSMEPIRTLLSTTRSVVIVSGEVSGASWSYANQALGPLLIVGQGATIAGAASPAFQMSSGEVTIRRVTFQTATTTAIGIEADGGTLRLDHVTVQNCKGGGIWLNGANFDIQNSRIVSDGPGTYGGFSWGGILETKIPGTAPTNISQVTVATNNGQGIICMNKLTGSGVLAYGNVSPTQVSTSCGLELCTDAATMCGAQP